MIEHPPMTSIEKLSPFPSSQNIKIENEVTTLCPLTGQEDFGSLTIHIETKTHYLEQKSLRDFIRSFRNTKIWQEEFADEILKGIIKAIDPQYVSVVLDYNTRGGVKVTANTEYIANDQSNPASAEDLLKNGEVGILTAGDNISLPVNFVADMDNMVIYIITDGRSKRVQHILNDPHCSFLIEDHSSDWDKTAAFFMKCLATISTSDPKEEILDMFRKKYWWYVDMEAHCGDECDQDVVLVLSPIHTRYFNGEDIMIPGGA